MLGLVLGLPLWRLLHWLAMHLGGYQPPWHYLQPYLPGGPVSAPALPGTRAQ